MSGDDAEAQENDEKEGILGDLPTLALAIVVALLIRTFLFQSFYVPSDSMLPTLLVGDHVFVNKFVFGAGVPFTEAHLPKLRVPERGEVVVFELARDGRRGIYPADMRPDLPTDAFVKRAIGIPGDRIAVKAGRIILNGEPVAWEATGEKWLDASGREFDVYIERLPGCPHYVLDDPLQPFGDMPRDHGEARTLLLHGGQPRQLPRRPSLRHGAGRGAVGTGRSPVLVLGLDRELVRAAEPAHLDREPELEDALEPDRAVPGVSRRVSDTASA